MSDWEPPRCEHGYILLGCPHNDCVAQAEYLAAQDAAMAEYESRFVLGSPPTDDRRT